MRWAVHSLNTSRGTTLEEFIDGLSDDDAAAEAEALLEMLEAYGNQLRMLRKSLGDWNSEGLCLTKLKVSTV